MSKVVNDDYPRQNPLSDAELKQLVLDSHVNTGTPDQFTNGKSTNVPTEVISLPSKGQFYPEGHPLKSGTIEMKYMTAKEEDILASQNLIKQGLVIDKLLQSLIVTRINYNELLTMDKNAIFIAARILAYGSDYDVEITCPACNDKAKHTIDIQQFTEKEIDWSHFDSDDIYYRYQLPTAKNTLTLKMLSHGDEKRIEEAAKTYKKAAKVSGVDREFSTRLKQAIVAVDDNEDRSFISSFVDNMFSRDSLALRTYMKQVTPDINTTFNYCCDSCGHEIKDMRMPIDVGFFWPGV